MKSRSKPHSTTHSTIDSVAQAARSVSSAPDQLISSTDNAIYKKIKSLLTAKGIKDHQLCILSGKKIIQEFIYEFKNQSERFPLIDTISFMIDCDRYADSELKNQFSSLKNVKLSADLFNEIDVLGTHYPLLILKLKPLLEIDLTRPALGPEVLLPLGDPRNLGAVCRSALAFNVNRLILTQEACHPFLPASIKASAGAVLKTAFFKTATMISQLPLQKNLIALDLQGQNLSSFQWPKDFRLILGEEGPGLNLSEEQKKQIIKVTIPINSVESLNANVSAAISFWDYHQKKQN